MSRCPRLSLLILLLLLANSVGRVGVAQKAIIGVLPESQHLEIRDPVKLPRAYLPPGEEPATVGENSPERTPEQISLDEAIRIALKNADVIRVLAGVVATNSGRTVFDPAIANTAVDRAQSRFDPTFDTRQDFLRNERPFAELAPLDPGRALFDATRNDLYDMTAGITKRSSTGAETSVRIDTDRSRISPVPGVLNPQSRPTLSMGALQPLLQGAGVDVNLVPVVLARIETDRSFFSLKDALQELVRGVISAYWQLVAARTNLWASQQQLTRSEFALRQADANLRVGRGDQAQASQSKLAYENFRAQLILTRAAVLDREAALRSILGLPPNSPNEFIPTTPPSTSRFDFDWPALVDLAEESRPDIIQLKLVLEADYQQLLQARNLAMPRLDASAIYRWNGLEGELVTTGEFVGSDFNQATDWRLGVDFSVPLGLRQGRANLRERQLLIARDRANLDQALLEVLQELAANLRDLESQYQQYEAFVRTRQAATENLRQQEAAYALRGELFVNLLLAISDWGNAVSNEAQAATQYNTDLATLERLSGTILEAHGIYFYEERYRSLGPLGILGPDRYYPQDMKPGPNRDRYLAGDRPSEESFDLQTPARVRDMRQRFRQRLKEREAERLKSPPPQPPAPEIERLPPTLDFPDTNSDD
ncbi:MAG: TolC family protein [Pirellulaceae bacterium]|nr:TolC family protein [Pirellulaceae bacterium]